MAVGELWRVSFLWQVSGVDDPMVNVFHYRQATASVATPEPTDVATAMYDDVAPTIAVAISDQISITTFQVRSISDPTVGGDVSFGTPIVGVQAGETYALQANPLIRWHTGRVGRHYQGRNWLPPANEAGVGGAGAVAGGYLTNVSNAAAAIMTIPASPTHAAYDLIVYSAPNPDAVPPWGGDATIVSSFSIAPFLKTQRRRGL